jgi:hypothetical protein
LKERGDPGKTQIISDPHELYRFLAKPGIEVTSLLFVRDDVWAAWCYSDDEFLPNLRHTNEVIGAYVTPGARMQLYAYLDSMKERAL